jgi:hypothetical protein
MQTRCKYVQGCATTLVSGRKEATVQKVEQWTGQLACALQMAAGMTNERFAHWLGISTRTVAYWHSKPNTVPGTANQEFLHAAFQQVSDAVRDRFAHENRQRGPAGPRTAVDPIARAVVATVDEVTSDTLLGSPTGSFDPPEALDQEIALLARATGRTAFDVFSSARRLREEARRQVDRTHRPKMLNDLYATIGQATSLMASTAFDLGHWNESAALARASTKYADLAGHASLRAWTLGLQMTLANWRNEPDAALAYFARGMSGAPKGEPRLRLRYIAARSYALLDDETAVAEILSHAGRDRAIAAQYPDDLATSIGGEFAFGDARAAACATACWLDLRNGEEAVKSATTALKCYEAYAAGRRPYSQINGILADMAAGRLLTGDREGAIAALDPVLGLPVGKRNISLAGRMQRVTSIIFDSAGKDDSGLVEVTERIGSWLAETSARPLS